jgi:hypothetical protein
MSVSRTQWPSRCLQHTLVAVATAATATATAAAAASAAAAAVCLATTAAPRKARWNYCDLTSVVGAAHRSGQLIECRPHLSGLEVDGGFARTL